MKIKVSKSEDESDVEESISPVIILLDEEEEESLLRESAADEDKDLMNVIAQVSSTDENPAGLNDIKVYLLALCALLQTATLLLSMHLFSDRHNKDEIYEMRHVSFLASVFKFAMACFFEYLVTQGNLLGSIRVYIFQRPKDAMYMLIPVLLFEVHDWLWRIALGNLRPHPFRLIQETRIIITALVSMRLLKYSYSIKQWFCMIAVWIGMYVSTTDHALSKTFWDQESSNTVLGYETVTLGVICFAVGSVYFEHIIKVAPDEGQVAPSLWMRLIQLSFFSIVIRSIDGGLVNAPDASSYFAGFGPLVWLLVVGQAAASLIVATTIYYTDNVLNCLAIATGSTLAAMLFAFSWDSESSGFVFLLGCLVVGMGVWFYCKPLPCSRRKFK